MNTAAIAPHAIDRTPACDNPPAIRVLAGGLGNERRPLHARAEKAVPTSAGADERTVRPSEGLRGVPYGLSPREQALAAAGGLLLTLAALASVMV